jgi:hypothetical protein
VAHQPIPATAAFIAVALLLGGIGCFIGAGWLFTQRRGPVARAGAIGLGALAVVSLVVGTALPLILGARPSLTRPSTTARLAFVSQYPGAVFPAGGGPIHIVLRLDGGRVVPFTSLRLVPNEGHIHLSLDGSLVAMDDGPGRRAHRRTGCASVGRRVRRHRSRTLRSPPADHGGLLGRPMTCTGPALSWSRCAFPGVALDVGPLGSSSSSC